MRGIEEELDPAGYSSLYVSGDWDAKAEARCINTLLSRRVDGIIVLMGRLSDLALKNCAKNVPTVVTGRSLQGKDLFSLNSENFEGARLATQHLIDLGHRHIAFIMGDVDHPDANERLRGYQATLEAAGLGFDSNLVMPGDFQETGGMLAVKQLIATHTKFTAIFAANDQTALGAALSLHQHGLRIPQDVSLVGFDDLPIAKYTLPPLTSIHQSAEELGRLAARGILALINGTKPAFKLPSPKLMIRESTAAPAKAS
jgi:LacI family transcriptional regulator